MKQLFFISILVFPLLLLAQKDSLVRKDSITKKLLVSPYTPHEVCRTFGIIVKALAGPLPQGSFCLTSLGFECGLGKNNSIGLYGYFNAYLDADDGAGAKPPRPETTFKSQNRGALLNIRHFFNSGKLYEKHDIALFTGILAEWGRQDFHSDKYYGGDSILSSQTLMYTAAGIQFGFIHKFKRQRFGIDCNIALMYNNRSVTTNYYTPNPQTLTQFQTYNLQGSFTFYYWIFRTNKTPNSKR